VPWTAVRSGAGTPQVPWTAVRSGAGTPQVPWTAVRSGAGTPQVPCQELCGFTEFLTQSFPGCVICPIEKVTLSDGLLYIDIEGVTKDKILPELGRTWDHYSKAQSTTPCVIKADSCHVLFTSHFHC